MSAAAVCAGDRAEVERHIVLTMTGMHLLLHDGEHWPGRTPYLPRGPMAVSFVLFFLAALDSFHHGDWFTEKQRYLLSLT